MPTYVYKREDGTTFEIKQRITEDPLETCPTTGQKIKRVIGGAGLIFKGEGFYLTDYARKKTAPSDSDSSGESSNGEATKKPATASESGGTATKDSKPQ